MEKLSLQSYTWKCVFGIEIFYFTCLAYGSTLSLRAKELHHSLFELMPWFTWGSAGSVIWGAIYLAIVAFIFGAYMVWMHNSSLVSNKN